jgi:hypothetical protein
MAGRVMAAYESRDLTVWDLEQGLKCTPKHADRLWDGKIDFLVVEAVQVAHQLDIPYSDLVNDLPELNAVNA